MQTKNHQSPLTVGTDCQKKSHQKTYFRMNSDLVLHYFLVEQSRMTNRLMSKYILSKCLYWNIGTKWNTYDLMGAAKSQKSNLKIFWFDQSAMNNTIKCALCFSNICMPMSRLILPKCHNFPTIFEFYPYGQKLIWCE